MQLPAILVSNQGNIPFSSEAPWRQNRRPNRLQWWQEAAAGAGVLLSLAECRLMVKAWVARKAECQGPAMVRQPQVKASVTRKANSASPQGSAAANTCELASSQGPAAAKACEPRRHRSHGVCVWGQSSGKSLGTFPSACRPESGGVFGCPSCEGYEHAVRSHRPLLVDGEQRVPCLVHLPTQSRMVLSIGYLKNWSFYPAP